MIEFPYDHIVRTAASGGIAHFRCPLCEHYMVHPWPITHYMLCPSCAGLFEFQIANGVVQSIPLTRSTRQSIQRGEMEWFPEAKKMHDEVIRNLWG